MGAFQAMRVLLIALLLCGSAIVGCGNDSGGNDATGDGDTGVGDGDGDGDGDSEAPELRYDTLSETGLFADIAAGSLADGVVAFTPRFSNFEDGKTSERFLLLPEGETIDTSDMAFWAFPTGTKAFQHILVDGERVETRVTERLEDDSLYAMAFVWRDDGSDADAAPLGMADADGSGHDVEAPGICLACHVGVESGIIGFSAIQLAHEDTDTSLQGLIDSGLLSDPPTEEVVLPGDETAQAALGLLHVNCGHCHNPRTGLFATAGMNLWLDPASLGSVEETTIYTTSVGVAPQQQASESTARITAGDSADSEVYRRMQMRASPIQMPPYLTDEVDTVGLDTLSAWVDSL